MLMFNRLLICGLLTLVLLVFELILWNFSHCLTLLCVANQSLHNFISIVFSAVYITLKHNDAPSLRARGTFGWDRVGVLGVLISFVVLVSQYFGTTVEALQTMSHLAHLDAIHYTIGVCLLAFGHFLVWCEVFRLVGGYTYNQKTLLVPSSGREKGGLGLAFNFNDICRDLASVVLQFLTAAVIFFIRFTESETKTVKYFMKYLDPLTAITGVVVTIWLSVPLFKRAAIIVLQGSPEVTALDGTKTTPQTITREIQEKFKNVVSSVHEVHLWSHVPDQIVATLHVKFRAKEDYFTTDSAIKDFLASKGVTCLTLQPEFSDPLHGRRDSAISTLSPSELDADDEDLNCSFQCVKRECQEKICCPTRTRHISMKSI